MAFLFMDAKEYLKLYLFNYFSWISVSYHITGTFFTATAPDAITALSPAITPGFITALPPIHTLFPIVIGFAYSLPEFRSEDKAGVLPNRFALRVQACNYLKKTDFTDI
ncbi:hypothetical protein DFO70_110125 [Cytobacillus firmus]|uniref:Uncharacterized protein n=2 Tax=Cytobacillus TaxID=2675230 RepID=A0A366JPK6_CYTFI|nr:hypothetical protein DFO70_110125 [Cytobacillus firmus]TDX40467.1 hypothetical protein DFO72_109136 [Cytobacillus oceanisediminis]